MGKVGLSLIDEGTVFVAKDKGPVQLQLREELKSHKEDLTGWAQKQLQQKNDVDSNIITKLMHDVVDYYESYTDYELSCETHWKKGAWKKAYKRNQDRPIKEKDIINEYKAISKIANKV